MHPTNFYESIFCLVILISGQSNHKLFWTIDISVVDFNVMATQPFFLISKNFSDLGIKSAENKLAFMLWFTDSKWKTGKLSEKGTKFFGCQFNWVNKTTVKNGYDYVL